MKQYAISIITFFLSLSVTAQDHPSSIKDSVLSKIPGQPVKIQRCVTTEYYDKLFKEIPGFRTKFEANQKRLSANQFNALNRTSGTNDTLAIAIHVIGSASLQSKVTDAILQSQIDVLNQDYAAVNADSTRIPASFKPLFGKMGITFILAQTDPDGALTNGIDRRTNDISFDISNFDNAKTFARGGLDAWDPTQYINIWVIDFGTTGFLGISVLPGDPRSLNLHGVICDYRAFGTGGSYLHPGYDKGRTTSHELGHFFNLRHTWGDDGGDCSGIDFPNAPPGQDDTPNQGDHTFGDPDLPGTGTVVTDNCSPGAPGIMYQNYMDYTDDVDLVMFTKGQVARMQSALTSSPDRTPLLNSITFRPPVIYTYDARLRNIVSPATGSAVCSTQFTPKITVRNQGSATLSVVTVSASVNDGPAVSANYSVNLPYGSETTLTLPAVSGNLGMNSLKVFTSFPSGNADQNVRNDTSSSTFKIQPILTLPSVPESFSTSSFPPDNWEIRNPDNDMTWEWNSSYGAKQPGSAWFNDFNNASNDRFDDLATPNYTYNNIDSIFLKFNLATAVYSDPATTTIPIDTLSVLISKDCGNTFTTVYKKWGAALQTARSPATAYIPEFFPNAAQWRRDSVNLGQWLGNSESLFQVSFRFSGNYENNIFLDDVDLSTKILPARLKSIGFLILPTEFQTQFAVWHYRQPTDLKFVNVYNSVGQLVWSREFSGNAGKYINVDLSGRSSGVYIVNLGYSDPHKNIAQKVMKR